VVTLLVPLARALAALHDRGLVHGQVTAASLLLTRDGRPMLADAGLLPLLRGPGEEPAAADDVCDLAASCRAAWSDRSGDDPPTRRPAVALDAALTAAMAPSPAERPSARELASAVFSAAAPEPLEPAQTLGAPGVGQVGRQRHAAARRAHRRSGWRAAAGSLLAATALSMAVLSGLTWARSDDGSPAAAVRSRTAVAATDWTAVLERLDAARATAYAAADPAALRAVYAADAPALARDRRQVSALATAGAHTAGLRLRTDRVTLLRRGAGRAELRVIDVLDRYELRARDGSLLARRPGRPRAAWTVTLVRSAGRWRIYDVVAS
jgi:hypothetical protein